MLKPITLEVFGPQQIVCEGCEERVETALKTLAGVKKVRASSRNQRIEVLLDTAVVEPAIGVEKLGAAGFQARFSQAA